MEVQAAVAHEPLEITAVAVPSKLPNSRPDTVTDVRPVWAKLLGVAESTGASNVKTEEPVPTTAPTLTNVVMVYGASTLVRH